MGFIPYKSVCVHFGIEFAIVGHWARVTRCGIEFSANFDSVVDCSRPVAFNSKFVNKGMKYHEDFEKCCNDGFRCHVCGGCFCSGAGFPITNWWSIPIVSWIADSTAVDWCPVDWCPATKQSEYWLRRVSELLLHWFEFRDVPQWAMPQCKFSRCRWYDRQLCKWSLCNGIMPELQLPCWRV